MRKVADAIFVFVMVVLDAGVAVSSFLTSYYVLFPMIKGLQPKAESVTADLIIAAATMIVVRFLYGIYSNRVFVNPARLAYRVFQTTLLALVLTILLQFAIKTDFFVQEQSRWTIVLYFIVCTVASELVWLVLLRLFLLRIFEPNRTVYAVVETSDDIRLNDIISHLKKGRRYVKKVLSPREVNAESVVGCEEICYISAALDFGEIYKRVKEFRSLGKDVIVYSDLFEKIGLHDEWLSSRMNKGLFITARQMSKIEAECKDFLDKLFCLIAVIALTPLLLGVAIAVKTTSKGPVIYKQERLGLNETPFKMLKFRSMRTDLPEDIHKEWVKKLAEKKSNDPNVQTKDPNDPRITKIGAIIRKTSIDELPQIFNVLRGEMSIVGPRPNLRYEVDQYFKDWYHDRYQVKPGLTGVWQVYGRSRVSFDAAAFMDCFYVMNRSIAMDMQLIFKTVWILATAKGAY